jgi:pectate lyase
MSGSPAPGSARCGAALAALCWLAAAWVEPAFGLPAFPGAEGFGAGASGGRGGRVVKVTNLSPSGPGSLQEAVAMTGPRIVVFAVSGEIVGDVVIRHGDLTIAGQSAPGGGITIRGQLRTAYTPGIDNIILRHIRIRPRLFDGSVPGDQYDALQFSLSRNFILDHLSVSWGVDETVDLYEAQDATLQWSAIEESATEGYPTGNHNFGFINGTRGGRVSVHHNIFAHHLNRCPAIATGPAEVVNNLDYDCEYGFVHHNPARGVFRIVGNYFRQGPSAKPIPFRFDYEGEAGPGLAYYLADNCIDIPGVFSGVVQSPWEPSFFATGLMYTKGFPFLTLTPPAPPAESGYVPVTTAKCGDAVKQVLTRAGAFPRDPVSRRTIEEVVWRTGSWGRHAPVDLMAGLTPTAAPLDTDGDGISDAWELDHGLDSRSAADQNRLMASGYTAIEEYINGLADALTAAAPPVTLLSPPRLAHPP